MKASIATDLEVIPRTIRGAAWAPQKARMEAGIYFPLYLVLATADMRRHSIFYLSADLQPPELFLERKPLSLTAQREGWQGFHYNVEPVRGRFVRLA